MSILRVDRHTNPKYSVLYIAGIILKEVQKNGIIHYEEMKERLVFLLDEKAATLFSHANAFLYLIGKIEYVKDLDSLKVAT